MSDDLLRTARQLLSELDATESFLRSLANETLSYGQVISLDRRANAVCAKRLAALGGTAFEFALDDTTDELLLGRSRDAGLRAARPAASGFDRPAPSAPSGFVYDSLGMDDGPEGAADAENDLLSEEGPTPAVGRAGPVVAEYEADTAEIGARGRSIPEPSATPNYVSYDRPPAPEESDDEPATVQARRPEPKATSDLVSFDALVTFDDPVVSSTPETVVRTHAPVSATSSVLDEDLLNATTVGDSFDLIGEDFVGFEDEEVTVVKTLPQSDIRPAKPVRPTADTAVPVKPSRAPDPPPAAAKPPDPRPPRAPVSSSAETPAPARTAAPPPKPAAPPGPPLPPAPPPAPPPRTAAPPPRTAASSAPSAASAVRTPPSSVEREAPRPAPKPSPPRVAPSPVPSPPVRTTPPEPARPKPPPKPAPKPQPAAAPSARVTAGLYGGSSVPTIRESDEPRPRAAAVQLNASGSGGRVLGAEEEDEPIEVGAADFETDLDAAGSGFSVKLQQFAELEDDDDEDASEISAEDLEVIRPNAVAPSPPSADEIRQMVLRAQNATASGQLQSAADLYSDVIDADPDNVPAHVARGRLYLDLGDYSRAMSDFMVAEDIAPNDPEPQVAIGDLYFARKDYAKAIEYFDDALRFSPNHPMAHCRRGISHYYRKNYREAVDDLLRAERLDPDIPNIQTYVAMAKKKVKR